MFTRNVSHDSFGELDPSNSQMLHWWKREGRVTVDNQKYYGDHDPCMDKNPCEMGAGVRKGIRGGWVKKLAEFQSVYAQAGSVISWRITVLCYEFRLDYSAQECTVSIGNCTISLENDL